MVLASAFDPLTNSFILASAFDPLANSFILASAFDPLLMVFVRDYMPGYMFIISLQFECVCC